MINGPLFSHSDCLLLWCRRQHCTTGGQQPGSNVCVHMCVSMVITRRNFLDAGGVDRQKNGNNHRFSRLYYSSFFVFSWRPQHLPPQGIDPTHRWYISFGINVGRPTFLRFLPCVVYRQYVVRSHPARPAAVHLARAPALPRARAGPRAQK